MSLLNGISFCPTALAGCTSVTDRQTDGRTTRGYISPIGGIADEAAKNNAAGQQ